MTVFLFYGIFFLMYGMDYFHTIMGSTKSDLVPLLKIPALYLEIFKDLGLSRFCFIFFLFIGLKRVAETRRSLVILVGLVLTMQFLAAALGQLKIGASYNYFTGFFMSASLFVTLGLRTFFDEQTESKHSLPIKLFFYFSIIMVIGGNFIQEAGSTYNQLKNYDYPEVAEYMQKHYPGHLVYSKDPTVILHFMHKTVLGPWAESFLDITGNFKREVLPDVRKRLKTLEDPILGIKTGSGCASAGNDSGFFSKDLVFEELIIKKGKICLFRIKKP